MRQASSADTIPLDSELSITASSCFGVRGGSGCRKKKRILEKNSADDVKSRSSGDKTFSRVEKKGTTRVGKPFAAEEP